MKRKIITINENKCNGCGLCVEACHEGALELVEGKAKLVSESYCDGLGDCLPECPAGAITIEEREAAPYNEEAVKALAKKKNLEQTASLKEPSPHASSKHDNTLACGCPGTQARTLERQVLPANPPHPTHTMGHSHISSPGSNFIESQLRQWPCQIKLVPVNAPYLDNAHLLVAADCTAYAYANMHQDFMRNKITLIGCPKLDDIDYGEKLTAILKSHEIKSITVLRMEVPCCGGMVNAVKKALRGSEKMIPWQVVTISTDGNIIEE